MKDDTLTVIMLVALCSVLHCISYWEYTAVTKRLAESRAEVKRLKSKNRNQKGR